jgi:hypothetical protein
MSDVDKSKVGGFYLLVDSGSSSSGLSTAVAIALLESDWDSTLGNGTGLDSSRADSLSSSRRLGRDSLGSSSDRGLGNDHRGSGSDLVEVNALGCSQGGEA